MTIEFNQFVFEVGRGHVFVQIPKLGAMLVAYSRHHPSWGDGFIFDSWSTIKSYYAKAGTR